MEILKQGKVIMANKFFVKCSYCGTEVKFVEGDTLVTPYFAEGGLRKPHLKYVCPLCKEIVDTRVNESMIVSTKILTQEERHAMNKPEWHVDENDKIIHSPEWDEYLDRFNIGEYC